MVNKNKSTGIVQLMTSFVVAHLSFQSQFLFSHNLPNFTPKKKFALLTHKFQGCFHFDHLLFKIFVGTHCSSLNYICNHFQLIYTRTDLNRLCRGQIYLNNSNPFLFDYLLKFILIVITFIRAQFSNPLSINSLYWA